MRKIKGIMLFLAGSAAGVAVKYLVDRKAEAGDSTQRMRADKNASVIATLNQLFMAVQNQKDIAGYLRKKGYKDVAIYGMGNVGRRLLDILNESGIEVLYGIDAKAENIVERVQVIRTEDITVEPDVVIVTPVFSYAEIEAQLKEKVSCDIVSIEDLLNEIDAEG